MENSGVEIERIRERLAFEARRSSARELARAVGVNHATVTDFVAGRIEKPSGKNWELLVTYYQSLDPLTGPVGSSASERLDASEWPPDWRKRAYALQLEAVTAGADDEEVATVKELMLNPELSGLWAGGKPSGERMKQLDGIEIGVRAWLRQRGRMVKPQ